MCSVMGKCCATTKVHGAYLCCRKGADVVRDGRLYCHEHDPRPGDKMREGGIMGKLKIEQWIKAFETLGAVQYLGVQFHPTPFLAYFVNSAGILNLAVPYREEHTGTVLYGHVLVNWRADAVQSLALLEASEVDYTLASYKYLDRPRNYRITINWFDSARSFSGEGDNLGDLVLQAITFGLIKTVDIAALAKTLGDTVEQ